MIRNRLSELLSERGLKTSRVAKEVKIARSSLTSMIQNDSEMVRYDAIDKLCRYLNIAPNDFFEFVPINIDFTFTNSQQIFSISNQNNNRDLSKVISFLLIEAEFLIDVDYKKELTTYDCEVELDEINFSSFKNVFEFTLKKENEQNVLRQKINELTPGLKNILFKRINKSLEETFKDKIKKDIQSLISFPEFNNTDEEEILASIEEASFVIKSNIFNEY
ncbi:MULTISPECIES: helix-turn-helix domain-containing protein [Staphylococcus]|uniref:helix-turn-helix domain-containing protein n=1 Tax=Staphylococcus TaxID=1279 RepID=UPI002DBE47B6|nr:helix-turn-helix transcriptional regulator [Staphylococcus xylosus]MEB7831016.1 helix-turn-helix transcriptional regulator [Staphylococcus xylosus]